jgi:hypothetical protein
MKKLSNRNPYLKMSDTATRLDRTISAIIHGPFTNTVILSLKKGSRNFLWLPPPAQAVLGGCYFFETIIQLHTVVAHTHTHTKLTPAVGWKKN